MRRTCTRTYKRNMTAVTLATAMILAGAAPALAAAPSNDDPASPTPITELPFTDTLDTTEATTQPEEPTSCNYGRSVWYSFTATERLRVQADTGGSDYATVIAVFKGTPSNASLVACRSGNPSRVSFEAAAGQTYHFMVSGTGGVLTFNADVAVPPPNDLISNAHRISSRLPFQHEMDATEATLTLSDPSCHGKARTVWYRYEKPAKGQETKVVMKTFRSGYDTTLSVYTGQRSDLQQIACNNDAGSTRQSKVQFVAKPGKRYFVMIGANNNSPAGQLLLTVKEAPLPLRMSIGIARTGSVSTVTGRARISGSLRCSRQTTVRIAVAVRQKVDDMVVSGGASKDMICRGERTWSLWVASSRAFKPGYVGAWMNASVPRQEKEFSENRVVRLIGCSSCM